VWVQVREAWQEERDEAMKVYVLEANWGASTFTVGVYTSKDRAEQVITDRDTGRGCDYEILEYDLEGYEEEK
jgi:hypothetical protein